MTHHQPPMFNTAHNKLVIIRGIPGAGKTTLANTKYPDYVRCEADDFPGLYAKGFNPKLRGKAHEWSQQKATVALDAGKDVVVSNTSLQLWEMAPYILMARKLDLPWENITIEDATYMGKSIHNVPDDKVAQMKARYQKLDRPVSEIDWAAQKR